MKLHRHINRHFRNAFIPHAGNDYHPHAFRHHWLGLYGVALVAVKVIVVGFVGLYAGQVQQSSVNPDNIVRLTNSVRQQNKLLPLTVNSSLTKAAASKAQDMINQHYFAHISPSRVTPWYWFKKAGYSYAYAGENLAIDFIQSEDVVQAWLDSPSHRQNLLSNRFKEIGVATASGEINGAQSIVVVQMFGAPVTKPVVKRVTAPATPKVTKVTIKPKTPTKVLGETVTPPPETPATPVVVPAKPVIPVIDQPLNNSLLNDNQPTIVGHATPLCQVTLKWGAETIGTATTGEDGVFRIISQRDLPEGTHNFRVEADAGNLVTVSTADYSLTVDTQAPVVTMGNSYALLSVLDYDAYQVRVQVGGDPVAVACRCGQPLNAIAGQPGWYQGVLRIDPRQGVTGSLEIAASDQAGNQTVTQLVDPELFTTGVAATQSSPTTKALRLLFFSQTFMIAFLGLMILGVVVNLSMNWRRQHHPALVGSLLLIYLAGALLVL